MPTLQPEPLGEYVAAILEGAGVPAEDAATVAAHLVDSNLKGHDSHGVIRTVQYLRDIASGQLRPGVAPTIERESDATAVLDGGWNLGQVVAHRATAIAVEKARATGLGAVAAYRCGHTGRVGAYGEQAAAAGGIGIVIVNNHGGGQVMSPPGGLARRLSPNPIVCAIPGATEADPPQMVLDMTTSMVAEGKLRVARNSGEHVPEGWAVDHAGEPITDPATFYGDADGANRGSILPLGGPAAHKGFGLALMVAVLAGALSPAGTSRPEGPRGANGLFVLAIDVDRFTGREAFAATFAGLVEYVRTPPLRADVEEVLIPGEPEGRTEAERRASGIAIDGETWAQLAEAGRSAGIGMPAP